MFIDHINTLTTGGAAVAARRLHCGLLQAGIGSRLWYSPQAGVPSAVPRMQPVPWPLPDGSMAKRCSRLAGQTATQMRLRILRSYFRGGRRKKSGGFLGVRQPVQTPFASDIFDGDIVHFHWVGRLIDFRSFFRTMPMDRPLVWSLHDMNPMTGGCYHAADCEGFTRTCGECPILGRPGPRDLSYQELAIKRAAFRGRPIFVIAPSYWMASMARKSSLFSDCRIKVIRNPIETAEFFPENKREARKKLGLPEEGTCLLYAAESVEVSEKGIQEYLTVLSQLSKKYSVFGLVFGRGQVAKPVEGVAIHSLGFLESASQLRAAYSAADIFVMPSHAETISQTTVEAFACRTPAVAFEVGGVPELVKDGETGFLARYRDAGHMAERVAWLIDHPDARLEMGQRGLELVQTEFEAAGQIANCIDYYSEILQSTVRCITERSMEGTSPHEPRRIKSR